MRTPHKLLESTFRHVTSAIVLQFLLSSSVKN